MKTGSAQPGHSTFGFAEARSRQPGAVV